MAPAAWSCVQKMLQLLQVTSAPSSVSVSISTAVWIVMCRQPAMRAPASGLVLAVLLAQGHQAGHLVLGELDLLAAPLGEALELGGRTIERLCTATSSWPLATRVSPGIESNRTNLYCSWQAPALASDARTAPQL